MRNNKFAKIAATILVLIGRILAFILMLVLAVPVILLPVSTVVPAFFWILFIAADIILLILYFRLKPVWIGTAAPATGVILVSLLAVVASQAYAMTPPITNADGTVLPNSIATLEKVDLNGSEQWISIRGKDINKPVLLFLAGGPGGSQLVTERRALAGLEDHFVVVNWEQPGAGKSYDAVKRSTLTPERYVTDGHELVLYLLDRFDEQKVFVLGESWGSALGVLLVQRYPELFHAFIGTGQMVAFTQTDVMCYEFAMQYAKDRGDSEKLAKLESQGPPPYYGKGVAWKQTTYLLDTFSYMNADPLISDDGFNTFEDLAGSEYGLYDKLNWFRGVIVTLDVVYPQLWDVDFRTQAAQLDVPVYFLIGRHDVNAPPAITEEYYNLLDAPHKELIWFERSGHNPWVTESSLFVEVIVNTVLAQTQTAR